MKKKLALLVAIAVAGVTAQGATITWGTPQWIAGDTDVNTQGTLVEAVNVYGTNSITLNGVTFSDTSSSISFTPGYAQHDDFVWDPTDPTISADYVVLLDRAYYQVSGITISGLTVGQEYLIQIWANDARGSGYVALGRSTFLNAGDGGNPTNAANNVELAENRNQGGTSTLGQYVIGTFTADADTETIEVNGFDGTEYKTEYAVVPAIQIRQIPEPATLGLIGALGGLFVFIRRRLVL